MLIVLNNKCNLNKDEFILYQKELDNINSKHNLILCPSNIYLSQVYLRKFILGTQNVSPFQNGAYTGEISSTQLKSLNVKYSIVGHSERRNYFNEDNELIKKKLESLLKFDITPILCIGEKNKSERDEILLEQLEIMQELEGKEKIVIAYEPIWAIGSGITPTIDEIEKVIFLIKNKFPNNKIIYGGSVDENSIINLKSKLIDGYLIGGLSLYPKRLNQFLKYLD